MRVELGDRSYPIVVGRLSDVGDTAAGQFKGGPIAVVTNDVVGPLHAETVEDSLRRSGFRPHRFVLPDGEAHKTVATWQDLVRRLLVWGIDRRTPVLALGGGVTGDLAGFAAATVMRGVPLMQVPTTLLAMVDSSVGGKTAVNTPQGKNLVGAFHQPRAVHVPLDALETLDDAEYRCGLGEVVKHAVLGDASFFHWLEAHQTEVRGRQPAAVEHMVRTCCRIKADVVRQDEREAGVRAVLNCGHTVGHALERVLGYGTLRHGEAVGIGLVAECQVALSRGQASRDLPRRIAALLRALGLPTSAQVSPKALVEAMQFDKKRAHGRIWIAYPADLGRVVLAEAEAVELLDAAEAASNPPEEDP